MLLIMFLLFIGMLAVFFDDTESNTESETEQRSYELNTSEFDIEFETRVQELITRTKELENEISALETKIKESEDNK